MKIKLIQIAKTDESYIQQGIDKYIARIKKYNDFESVIISSIKSSSSLSIEQQKKKEGELLFEKISTADFVILLDERGKEFNSPEMAQQLQKRMNAGLKNLVFVIGGAYGFSEEVYKRANDKWALSRLTFSHQMVRLFFVEQLYRSFSILANEPYHH